MPHNHAVIIAPVRREIAEAPINVRMSPIPCLSQPVVPNSTTLDQFVSEFNQLCWLMLLTNKFLLRSVTFENNSLHGSRARGNLIGRRIGQV